MAGARGRFAERAVTTHLHNNTALIRHHVEHLGYL